MSFKIKWKTATSPRMFSSISISDSRVFINAEIYIRTVLMFALMGTSTQGLRVFIPFLNIRDFVCLEKF